MPPKRAGLICAAARSLRRGAAAASCYDKPAALDGRVLAATPIAALRRDVETRLTDLASSRATQNQLAFVGTLLIFGGLIELIAWLGVLATLLAPTLLRGIPGSDDSASAQQAVILARWFTRLAPVGVASGLLAGAAIWLGLRVARNRPGWPGPAQGWAVASIVVGIAALAVGLGIQGETLEAVRASTAAPAFSTTQRTVFSLVSLVFGALVLCGPPTALLIWMSWLRRGNPIAAPRD